jgi:hypothetical protein
VVIILRKKSYEYPLGISEYGFQLVIFCEINSTSDGGRIADNEFIFFQQDDETAHTGCSLMVVLREGFGEPNN